MDLKEASEIRGMNWVSKYWDGHTPDEVRDFQNEAKGFIEATKAAEPLVDLIEKQSKALEHCMAALEDLDALNWGDEGRPFNWDEIKDNGEEALTSSSLVVAEYRKTTLGEE